MKSPMTWRTTSAAAPLRGTAWTHCGASDSSRYGSAMPAPMAPKVASVTGGGWSAAHAAALPMNGAVHGVESTAVMIPNRNEPCKVSWLGFTAYAHCGAFTSNTPSMPTAITATTRPTTSENQPV